MTKEEIKEEKECLFFASDYHFEMITLPYINKKLEKNKNVVVLSENNLEETVKMVISRINLDEKIEKQILQINWNNNDLEKFKKIKQLQKQGKDVVIFIKGKKNYIKNINENIKNWGNGKNTKIVDCYDIDEVIEEADEIAEKYSRILTTII